MKNLGIVIEMFAGNVRMAKIFLKGVKGRGRISQRLNTNLTDEELFDLADFMGIHFWELKYSDTLEMIAVALQEGVDFIGV